MAGRFLSTRDNDFFHKVNKELLGDSFASKEGIINQEVTIYQIDERDTATDMYGESASGKSWKDGVSLKCLIEAEDFDFNADEFGADKQQNATFSLPDAALAIRTAIAFASPPVLANRTISDQGCNSMSFSANRTSSGLFKVDILPFRMAFLTESFISRLL